MANSTTNRTVRERFNISRLAIAHPWLTIGFWIAITVAGIMAFSSLKYALFPDITFPVVVVQATTPLQPTLETEAKLTKPIERSLESLEKLDSVRSSTYPGQSVIILSFEVGTQLEQASQKVETTLKGVTLPPDASFTINPVNLNESAAISYAIESPSKNLDELTKLAREQILPSIAKLPGVLKIELLGAADNNTTRVRFNGKDALAFQVIKSSSANTLEVVGEVEKQVQRLQSALPDVKLSLASTQADYIREATQATIDSLALAVVLAVVVIYPFLWNWKATFITALAIPTSLLGTFIVMAIFGFNLETITLLALALVIGIIVDDAIVDVENIARHLEEGEHPRSAAISATNEIALTVSAATFTIVAVFLPVGLMGGVVGQFFKPFGITVSVAVLTSWLVARTLSPVLAVYWLKATSPRTNAPDSGGSFIQSYRKLLNWSLRHKLIVLGLALLSFVVGLGLIGLVPKGFIPKLDRPEFKITYAAPLSTAGGGFSLSLTESETSNPLSESLENAKKLEEFVLRQPEVEKVFTIVGSPQGESNKGSLYVKLRDNRQIHAAELQERWRQQLPEIEGVRTSIEDIQFIETGDQKPLQVALKGEDLVAIGRAAAAIKEKIENVPGLADVTVTGENTDPENIFQIEHLNSQRVAYISANLSGELPLGDATDRVVDAAKEILPAGVSLNLGGDSARSGEIFGSFGTTLGLSVICILGVLIWLFKSWIDPLAIVFSLPLSLVGAMVALLMTRSDFGMIAAIGIIFLMGLTNKSAILLVDYFNQLHDSGLSRTEAILTAAPVRLRPILMTTASTILGMLPIALGIGAGSELRAPMAIAIIGGLVASTLLSLIVVPVLYALLHQPRKRNPVS